jgi:hypothetical protein
MPITRRWPKRAPKGDYAAECADCGVLWRRSELQPKGDGQLFCPDCIDGRDAVTLNDLNARAAASLGPTQRVYSGGNFTRDDYSDVTDVAEAVGNVTFGRQGFGGG